MALAGGVRSDHHVVDMLCGHSGDICIPAAQLVGSNGKVYAVDLRKSALDSVKGKCQTHGVGNIDTIHANLERFGGVPLDDGSADAVFVVDALSMLQNRLEVVKEAVRLLKSGGVLTVVDWHPHGDAHWGPPVANRLSEAQARSICLVADLQHEGGFNAGQKHWGFTCRKN